MTTRDSVQVIAIAQREYQCDVIQISSCTKVARADEGDWVEAWLWIPQNEDENDVPQNVVSIFSKKTTKIPSTTPGDECA